MQAATVCKIKVLFTLIMATVHAIKPRRYYCSPRRLADTNKPQNAHNFQAVIIFTAKTARVTFSLDVLNCTYFATTVHVRVHVK